MLREHKPYIGATWQSDSYSIHKTFLSTFLAKVETPLQFGGHNVYDLNLLTRETGFFRTPEERKVHFCHLKRVLASQAQTMGPSLVLRYCKLRFDF